MMGADDGWEPQHRDVTNLNPPLHDFPPREGDLSKFRPQPGHAFLLGGGPLAHFELPGRMDTNQGQAPPLWVSHINPLPHDTPLGGYP